MQAPLFRRRDSPPPWLYLLWRGVIWSRACARHGVLDVRALFTGKGFPLAARNAFHRRRCASAILARPAVVFGPVDSPPWKRQRRLPGSTRTPHGLPWRLRAPHIGRSFRGNGMQLPFKPSARSSRQSAPILQQWSETGTPKLRGRTGNEAIVMPTAPSLERDSAAGRRTPGN
jgi:hypothetical protein